MATNTRARSKSADIDETLKELPGGHDPLDSVHDANAKEILELAAQLVKDARRKLGPSSSKPRVKDVEKLFTKHAGNPRKVPESLDTELRRTEHVERVAQLDEDWDKSVAAAVNAFDRVSVSSGSKVQVADDKWMLAVRIYESESRSAGAIFKAEIDRAKARDFPHLDGHVDAHVEVDFYSRSSDIGAALVVYEQTMATATGNLATEFGELIKELFVGFTDTAVGEAELINATQSASKTFWTNVQAELNDRS